MSEVSKGIRWEKTPEEIMNEKVFQSIGEASICWSVVPTGVFDSVRAKRIGDELLDHIQKENQGLRESLDKIINALDEWHGKDTPIGSYFDWCYWNEIKEKALQSGGGGKLCQK